MRRASLVSLRSRVERLAEACRIDEDRLVIRWSHPYDACPRCGFDLDQYACTQAIADADASDAREAPDLPVHRRVVFYWWPDTVAACPHCQTPLAVLEALTAATRVQ